MNYQKMSTSQLRSLWQQLRTEMATKETHDCMKEMGELYKIRKELERREGDKKPIVFVNFEKYVTD